MNYPRSLASVAALASGFLLVARVAAAAESIETVARPATARVNPFYVGNRAPLLPGPLVKLPIGSIKPQGWLRQQLELQAGGFFGHLTELSRFLIKEGNPWLSPVGEGENSGKRCRIG